MDFFIIGRDQFGLESLGYNGVGIENGLNKVIARKLTSGRTEVGTFLFSLLVDGVAGNTTLTKIEGLAVGDVSSLRHGQLGHFGRLYLVDRLPAAGLCFGEELLGMFSHFNESVVIAVDGILDLLVEAGHAEIGESEEEAFFTGILGDHFHDLTFGALLDKRTLRHGQERTPGDATFINTALRSDLADVFELKEESAAIGELGDLAFQISRIDFRFHPVSENPDFIGNPLPIRSFGKIPQGCHPDIPGPFGILGRSSEELNLTWIRNSRHEREIDRVLITKIELGHVDTILTKKP